MVEEVAMKRTCIQCGKEFELTNSEMDFYRKKNLNLPKRCQECREKNKRQTGTPQMRQSSLANSSPASGSLSVSGANGPASGRHNLAEGRGGKGIMAAAAGIILLLAMLFCWKQTDILSDGNGTSSAATGFQTAAPSPEASISVQAPATSPQESAAYTFRSEKLLLEHYKKHGIDMGFDSAEAYVAAANQVIANPDSLHKLEAEDGDDVYYLEATNEFVVVSTDGYIRTYFNPNDGIDYYNRQ